MCLQSQVKLCDFSALNLCSLKDIAHLYTSAFKFVNNEQDDDDKAAKVSNVFLEVLHSGVRQAILNRFRFDTVGLTPKTFTNGAKYSQGMILSVGGTGVLPDFGSILEICIALGGHICLIKLN